MKKILIVCAYFVSLTVFSQTKVGVELGVGISNRTNIDKHLKQTDGILSIQSEIGTNVAFLTQLNLGERLFLKTGAVYQSMVYTEKVDAGLLSFSEAIEPFYCFLPNETQEGRTSIKYKYNFIEVPFVINYQFAQSCEDCGWKWFIGLGPTVSWVVNKKVKTDLIKDANFVDYACVPTDELLLGLQASLSGEYRFSNQHFLNLSLVYDQQLQSVYNNSENQFRFYSIGFRAAYYFALSANK